MPLIRHVAVGITAILIYHRGITFSCFFFFQLYIHGIIKLDTGFFCSGFIMFLKITCLIAYNIVLLVLYENTVIYISLLLSMYIWLGFRVGLSWIILSCTFLHVFDGDYLCAFLLGVFSQKEALGHRESSCSVLLDITKQYANVFTWRTLPLEWGDFWLSHGITNTWNCWPFSFQSFV